jgi:hypothetical protein
VAVSGKQRDVLTVFLFDERESEQVEDWQGALKSLADDHLLWLALRDPTEVEVAALRRRSSSAARTRRGSSSSPAARLWRTRASACT